MLKYVERLANSLPDLACGVKRKRGVCDAVRWSDHSELSFKDAAIDDTVAGESEVLLGWSPPSAGRYYLVLDLYSAPEDPLAPWQFDLELLIQ